MNAEEIYEQYIRGLSRQDRLRLLSMLADGLAGKPCGQKRRRITELAGLGKEIWQSVDAEQYVDSSRDEREYIAP